MSTLYGDSTYTLDFTYVNDSLVCSRTFYLAHISWAWITVLAGLLCFITRLHPKLLWYHPWFGKLYVLGMVWATGFSIVIHNAGLPTGVLWSFLWVILGLSIGWILITIHQKGLLKDKIKGYEGDNRILKVLSDMLSLKALHGCFMFVSWINIAGRAFITPITNDFGCYTQPAYKPITSKDYTYKAGSPIEFVATHSPSYNSTPWAYHEGGWAAGMSLGVFAAAFLVGFALNLCWPNRSKAKASAPIEAEQPFQATS